MTLNNKKILIIIGGGIAAYKSLDLIRLLRKESVEIKTILTKSGNEFVTSLSLSTLTKNKTYQDMFDQNLNADIDHIALSRWADLIVVMPTTANFMSKLSVGKAEDLATTVLLASNKDILLVPAMNVRMWVHKATQSNLKILQDFGYLFIGPEKGEMACGEFGEGKMSSPRQIYGYLKNYFDKKNLVKNRKWKAIVTTGPTREYIDPVRYFSNESSGKQGCEIAIALNKLGISTTLIAGPTNLIFPKNLKVKKITTADEMLKEVKNSLPVDLAVCAAAVTDFKPAEISKNKIKKENMKFRSINFIKNNDILEYISNNNKHRPRLVAGFSAETESLKKNTIAKIKVKHCDLMFANDVSQKDIGFNSDYNKISVIDKIGNVRIIPKNKKSFIAGKIAEILLEKLIIDDRNIN
jgi:phosphopantothenoylcysteine decarboxylase / phosphopantothenate---cysteine ligase